MVQKSKKTIPSKKPAAKVVSKSSRWKRWTNSFRDRVKNLKLRRPHHSFKRTYRRDYVRSLKISGYWAFTNEVRAMLWRHKKTFFWLVIIYGALTAAIIGIASQTA